MLRANADDIAAPRQRLVGTRAVAGAVALLAPDAGSRVDLWSMVVDRFAVDLDALAEILPPEETEPAWLASPA